MRVSIGLCININKVSKSVPFRFINFCQGFWEASRRIFYPLPPPHSDQMSLQAQPMALVNSRLPSLQFQPEKRAEVLPLPESLKNLREELQQAQ